MKITDPQRRKERATSAELMAEIKFLGNKKLAERLMMKERLTKARARSQVYEGI